MSSAADYALCPCPDCTPGQVRASWWSIEQHRNAHKGSWLFVCPCSQVGCNKSNLLAPNTIRKHLRAGSRQDQDPMSDSDAPDELDESESTSGTSESDETDEADDPEVMRRLFWLESAENKCAFERAQYAPSEPESNGSDVSDEDSSDEDSGYESHLSWEFVQDKTREFAKQLLEAVGTGTLTMKGVDAVLKVLHNSLFKCVHESMVYLVPRDSRTLESIAGGDRPVCFQRHFCPGTQTDKDHFLFPEDGTVTRCPICEEDTRFTSQNKPARPALYYSLDDYLQRVFENPVTGPTLRAWRPGPSTKASANDMRPTT